MHRGSWVWAVLPADVRRVACLGQPDLGRALSHMGLEVAASDAIDDGEQLDAVLVDDDATAATRVIGAAAEGDAGLVVVVVGPSASPSVRLVPRTARALQLLASPAIVLATEAASRRVQRTMRRRGLAVSTVRIGNRSLSRYGVGPGGWLTRRRLPEGAVVVGSTGKREPSAIDEVLAKVTDELREPLERVSTEIFPSGKLAIELLGQRGCRFFLSITAGEGGRVDRPEKAVRAILDAEPPAALRDRIVEPLARGTVGPVRYVLEPKAAGRHPTRMTGRLWEQSVDFLVALHRLPSNSPEVQLPNSWPSFTRAAEILGQHVSTNERSLLERVAHVTGNRVQGLELGGGHGDFFTQNLLVSRGRLSAVLDWEWAARDCLPLLDLLDLRAQLGWLRRRGLRAGQNFTDILWPLAREGGDKPIRAYCAAVGVPGDPSTLKALTVAHWLLRTARLGSIDPRRLEDSDWRLANIAAPLAKIRTEGIEC